MGKNLLRWKLNSLCTLNNNDINVRGKFYVILQLNFNLAIVWTFKKLKISYYFYKIKKSKMIEESACSRIRLRQTQNYFVRNGKKVKRQESSTKRPKKIRNQKSTSSNEKRKSKALLKKEIEKVGDLYKCIPCGKLFNKENNVKKHLNAYHVCNRCDKVYPKNILHIHNGFKCIKKEETIKNQVNQFHGYNECTKSDDQIEETNESNVFIKDLKENKSGSKLFEGEYICLQNSGVTIVQEANSPEKQNGDASNMPQTNNSNIFATMEKIIECTNTRELPTQLDVDVSKNEFEPLNFKGNEYIHFDFDKIILEEAITQECLNDLIVQDESYQNKVLVNEENPSSPNEKKVRKRKSTTSIDYKNFPKKIQLILNQENLPKLEKTHKIYNSPEKIDLSCNKKGEDIVTIYKETQCDNNLPSASTGRRNGEGSQTRSEVEEEDLEIFSKFAFEEMSEEEDLGKSDYYFKCEFCGASNILNWNCFFIPFLKQTLEVQRLEEQEEDEESANTPRHEEVVGETANTARQQKGQLGKSQKGKK